MHKKIQDMAYGRFRWERPKVQIDEEQLEFEVMQGENYRGSFIVSSMNQIPVRGKVCSANPRIRCLNPVFSGKECRILFEFESSGLPKGSTEKGEITVISDGGEYSLLFAARITEQYMLSSVGKVSNLDDFVRLAKGFWEEAFHMFRAPFFDKLMQQETEDIRKVFRNLGERRDSAEIMEKFLLAVHKKEPVTFTIQEKRRQFAGPAEDEQETIAVEKKGWGYLEINITSDNPALEPVKNRITADDFVGNKGTVEFIIKKKLLHSGNNFGRIALESGETKEACEIRILNRSPEEENALQEKRALEREEKQLRMQLTELYLDFRMKRIVTGEWAKQSRNCLMRLKELFPDNLWYTLYQAQTFLVNREYQEADWILDRFRKEPVKKDTPLYAYYLYLNTLKEKEPSYVAKRFGQIQEIYRRNQEDLRMFLMMLFSDPQFAQSRSRKLAAIREKVSGGMHSPILYMEAYYLIQKDVYLLQHLENFEMQVLNWAVKKQAVTEKVAVQVSRCMDTVRMFHPIWYRVLEACYRVNPQRDILMSVCSYCIKWNRITAEQFIWFDRGVKEGLKIAGLYEAWLESAVEQQIEEFPKQVMIYFQYKNNLNAKKKAALYAAIIRHKDSHDDLYKAYEKKMEQFAIDEMWAGKKDENLSVIYDEFLKDQELPDISETEENCREAVMKTDGREAVCEILRADSQETPDCAGSLKELEQQWKIAMEAGTDTRLLEEHFLEQLLYTEGQTEAMGEIFKNYFHSHGQELLLLAFLSYVSYRYCAEDFPFPKEAGDCLEQQILLGNMLNDICRLAYLKFLVELQVRTKEQEHFLEELLEEFAGKGKIFGFYEKLPDRLRSRYHFNDGRILQYHTKTARRVLLRYSVCQAEENISCESDMEEMYDGIFVKHLALFYGEKITYSICEKYPEREMAVVSGCVERMEEKNRSAESRYDFINHMLILNQRKDGHGLKQLRDLYEQRQRLAEETYKLL